MTGKEKHFGQIMDIRDDDEVKLPDDTQAILNQFLMDKTKQDKEDLFAENWNLSQFWYSDETQKVFGKVVKNLLRKFEDGLSIALMSCPSLYQTIKSINDHVKIFEFDERFNSLGEDFQFYDYNKAVEENYLAEFATSFDLIIVDPPFLSEECLEKTSLIVKRLMKVNGLIVLNTGSVQRELAAKFLNLKESSYRPQHKNNLGNEFSSFANFDLEKYL